MGYVTESLKNASGIGVGGVLIILPIEVGVRSSAEKIGEQGLTALMQLEASFHSPRTDPHSIYAK